MLIIPIKEGEAIERALKRYKRKFDKTKMMRELRGRKHYTKRSVSNRQVKLKATYIQLKRQREE